MVYIICYFRFLLKLGSFSETDIAGRWTAWASQTLRTRALIPCTAQLPVRPKILGIRQNQAICTSKSGWLVLGFMAVGQLFSFAWVSMHSGCIHQVLLKQLHIRCWSTYLCGSLWLIQLWFVEVLIIVKCSKFLALFIITRAFYLVDKASTQIVSSQCCFSERISSPHLQVYLILPQRHSVEKMQHLQVQSTLHHMDLFQSTAEARVSPMPSTWSRRFSSTVCFFKGYFGTLRDAHQATKELQNLKPGWWKNPMVFRGRC